MRKPSAQPDVPRMGWFARRSSPHRTLFEIVPRAEEPSIFSWFCQISRDNLTTLCNCRQMRLFRTTKPYRNLRRLRPERPNQVTDSSRLTRQPVKTVERAFSVLRAFSGGAVTASVTHISQQTGLHKSTVSRLLSTLEHLDLVVRDPESDKYRLGPEIIQLAAEVPFRDFLIAIARPLVSELAESTGETVKICFPEGDRVLHSDQVESTYLVGRRDWKGMTCPMHCASSGKVLLAYWTAEEIERYLSTPLERFTERTITHPDQLRQELASVRKEGIAWGLEELEIGLIGVSAPIFDSHGSSIASVSMSGPAYRFPPEIRPELAGLAHDTGTRISAKLARAWA